MDDGAIYNGIIVSLFIGILVVIVTLVVAAPEPERFTELYFNDHQELDKYSYDGYHDFSFTIHNLEGEDRSYDYYVLVDGNIVKEGRVFVKDEEEVKVNEFVQIDIPFERAKIGVKLPGKEQEIHFWVKYTTHTWVDYEGRGDGAVDCLPETRVNIGDFIIVKMRGSYAEGYPIMEVWVNGKKVNEIEVLSGWDEYVVYGVIEEDSVIDLAFVNNYGIYEDDYLVWDRNIYVEHIRTEKKSLVYVYDRNEWDCEDLKLGDMYWNGALRFKVSVE